MSGEDLSFCEIFFSRVFVILFLQNEIARLRDFFSSCLIFCILSHAKRYFSNFHGSIRGEGSIDNHLYQILIMRFVILFLQWGAIY